MSLKSASVKPARATMPKARRQKSMPKRGALTSDAGSGSIQLGAQIRVERMRQERSLREFARSIDISASMISQIECGRAMPSVGTLFAIATELNLPFDKLFSLSGGANVAQPRGKTAAKAPRASVSAADIVQRGDRRQQIQFNQNVTWERLTALPDDHVEFIHVRYEPGASSAPGRALIQHGGKEYVYLISGHLGFQIGKTRIKLAPADSISFDSQVPHCFWTIGDEPANAIWFITNRTDDPRRMGKADPGSTNRKSNGSDLPSPQRAAEQKAASSRASSKKPGTGKRAGSKPSRKKDHA